MSQSLYLKHLNRINDIRKKKAIIKDQSRLEDCHQEASKLRKINFNFQKQCKL